MKDQFDLDDLFEPDMPQPPTGRTQAVPEKPVVMMGDDRILGDDLRSPVYVQRSSSENIGCLMPAGIASIALAVGFVLGLLFASWRGSNGDAVEPDADPVSGEYVAIFYNDTDLDKYTQSQRDFINSAITADFLQDRNVNWKKIDTDPLDVSKLEKPFQVMAEKHRSKEPWIVIASGKKFASEPIESNDQAMKLLQKWVK